MLIQFIAAFDDIVIGRHNKDREEKEKIKVRYVHAPKERVLFDIVNKQQNLTLPVVAINVTQIARDEKRVFHKNEPVYKRVSLSASNIMRMPVPVTLSVSMSILASYQSDIDQIISNFIPYTNPYVIISWKIPEEFGLPDINEIRSEVLWDGTLSMEYPVEATATDKPRFIGTTSFTIKGWLFPEAPDNVAKNIYFIDANFHSVSAIKPAFSYYPKLSSIETGVTEYVTLTGKPDIINTYILENGVKVMPDSDEYRITDKNQNRHLLILGKRFLDTDIVLLSSDTVYTNLSTLNRDFTYYPSISGYIIPETNYNILDKNTMVLTIPTLSGSGEFKILFSNKVGYTDTTSGKISLFRDE